MPRPRPPYLLRERNRYGTTVWYFRIGRGPRVRIRGEYGSPEFTAAYRAAMAGETPQRGPSAAPGTLAWLIARYHDSGAWARLSAVTRRQYESILRQVIETAGGEQFSKITRKNIVEGCDRRRASPFSARAFLKVMRGLFHWALDVEHVAADPTAGVRCAVPRTEGFHVWSEEEIARFEAYWSVGTRERLALAILLYTGLRRADAAILGRQHIRDGVITLRTQKNGVQVVIPILPVLAEVIAATKTGDLTFIATAQGAPMNRASMGNWFRLACRAAGVPGSAHGLRKAGATRAADNGATEFQLNAIYGWIGLEMARLYTRASDRKKLAKGAMGKLAKDKT